METDTDMAPRDPYNIVYFLFYFMALGSLLPWNFFITVNGYWMYKFRTVGNNSLVQGEGQNPLQLRFTSDLSVASQVPNLAFLLLNGLVGHKLKTTPR